MVRPDLAVQKSERKVPNKSKKAHKGSETRPLQIKITIYSLALRPPLRIFAFGLFPAKGARSILPRILRFHY